MDFSNYFMPIHLQFFFNPYEKIFRKFSLENTEFYNLFIINGISKLPIEYIIGNDFLELNQFNYNIQKSKKISAFQICSGLIF